MNEGLIYSIQTTYEKNTVYTNYSSYLIKATCSPENLNLLADSIEEELTRLITEGPSDKELTSAKKVAIHNSSSLNPEGLHYLDWVSALNNDLYRDVPNILKRPCNYDEIRVEDLKTFMQAVFVPENRVQITIQGQKSD
jgi:predicted Zn-dependent peptidase